MKTEQIKSALVHAVTAYDRRASTRQGFNRFALPQYLMRVDEVAADIERGANPRSAINAGFSGRLADVCLKAIGEAKTTTAEAFSGSWTYQSVSKGGAR